MKTAKVGDVATQIRGVTYNKADVIDVPRDGFLRKPAVSTAVQAA